MKFRVVAERPAGIFRRGGERPINPFLIRDIFDPNLRQRLQRRTWSEIEATDEAALRKLFAEYERTVPDARGFRIVSVEAAP